VAYGVGSFQGREVGAVLAYALAGEAVGCAHAGGLTVVVAYGAEDEDAIPIDLPNAVVQLLPTGHFALETHLEEIVGSMRDFLQKHVS
jgi:hypothetical protein